MQSFDILVRGGSGTYTTETRRGQRASCTAGPRQAAERLGSKVFGDAYLRVLHLRDLGNGQSTWRIFANTEG